MENTDRNNASMGKDIFETRIGTYTIRMRRVDTLSYFKSVAQTMRNGIVSIQAGLVYATYGADPCVNGIAIPKGQDDPSFFHIDPTQFSEPVREIDSAIGGIMGGSVEEYAKIHPNVRTGGFIQLPGSPVSMLVQREEKSLLSVMYMSGM